MSDLLDLATVYVGSFSPVQGCWHIETLTAHILSNARCLARGVLKDTSYCAVVLAASHDEAHNAIARIKAVLSEGKEGDDHGDD